MQIYDLSDFRDYTKWTAYGNDTTNLAAYAYPLSHVGAIEFDKANGSDNKTYAGVYRSDLSLDFTKDALSSFTSEDRLVVSFHIGALTNVASLTVELGTSASHAHQWTIADSSMTASYWQSLSVKFGTRALIGSGWTPAAVVYMGVKVNFDGETNALEDIRIDRVYLVKNTPTVS
jgi:hypothetical protein